MIQTPVHVTYVTYSFQGPISISLVHLRYCSKICRSSGFSHGEGTSKCLGFVMKDNFVMCMNVAKSIQMSEYLRNDKILEDLCTESSKTLDVNLAGLSNNYINEKDRFLVAGGSGSIVSDNVNLRSHHKCINNPRGVIYSSATS